MLVTLPFKAELSTLELGGRITSKDAHNFIKNIKLYNLFLFIINRLLFFLLKNELETIAT